MGTSGFLSRQSREIDPHLERRKENTALLELWRDPRCSSRVEMVMSGNCLSFLKGVKDPFEAQEGRWDFSPDAAVENGLLSCGGENLMVFLELWQETWDSSWIMTGTSGTCSCCLRKVKSPCELRGAFWDSSPVSARA